MKVLEFIKNFNEQKVQNTKIAPNAVSEFLKKELEKYAEIDFDCLDEDK